MKRSFLILFISIAFCLMASAQIGGTYTYSFLNQTNSARVASLGGKVVSLPEDDLNLPFHNPALLSPDMSDNMLLNYVGYFAGIKYGYASYAKSYKTIGNFAVGLHYIDYGDFTYADVNGIRDGEFGASEYALNMIYSRKIDSFIRVGITVKPIYSSFEKYNSIGIATDLGIEYFNPAKLFSAGLVLKNIGTQITTYYGSAGREPLPFEIQAGISQKLAYAPFRFSILLQHMQKWDLSYESTLDNNNLFDPLSGEGNEKSGIDKFADNMMRHVILGMEFLPTDNFYVSLGYNYLRRQELKISTRPAMVGFSWGFGLKVSKFHLSYGRASYSLAGASNHFSISTNLAEFYHRN
jgi:hypothetical protein